MNTSEPHNVPLSRSASPAVGSKKPGSAASSLAESIHRPTADGHGNSDLSERNLNLDVSSLIQRLFPSSPTGETVSESQMMRDLGNDWLPESDNTLLSCGEHEIVDLQSSTVSYINVGNSSGEFIPAKTTSITPKKGRIMLPALFADADELAEAVAHTAEAKAVFLERNLEEKGLSESRQQSYRRSLRRAFETELFYDPMIGRHRAITVPELLVEDHGRLAVSCLRQLLGDDLGLDDVVCDVLRDLRVFLRSISDGGALLPSGVNLRRRWGILVCPIADGDVPKRQQTSHLQVPDEGLIPLIYEASLEWARSRRRKTGYRSAVMLITAFGSGMRGAELRSIRNEQLLYPRILGPGAIPNPLVIKNAKTGGYRGPQIDPYPFELLRWYLTEVRPAFSADDEGFFFPNSWGGGVGPLSSQAFSATVKPLLDHLKLAGLLDASFTFHSARKTFATNYLARTGDLPGLLQQCGWMNPNQLGVYICPRHETLAARSEQFHRSVGMRRAA